jgi:transposase
VAYDFYATRAHELARTLLADWKSALVCDDFSGYKTGFANGMKGVGCLAHAWRKFFNLHDSHKSQIAAQALLSQLYDVERDVKHLPMSSDRPGKPYQNH